MRAHIASLISVHVGVGQCCRAIDVESPTILPTMNTLSHVTFQRGARMTVHGEFKMRAHIASLISVHVGVGQRCRARDVESPAIKLPTQP